MVARCANDDGLPRSFYCYIYNSSNNIKTISDRSAKYIVNIYKAAIVVIFHRFFKELEDIKTSMLDIDMLSREEIKPYECEIYTPTAEELDLKNEEEFQEIKVIAYLTSHFFTDS